MPEPVKRIVRASDAVMADWRPGAAWDLTEEVRKAAADARAAGLGSLLVILSADGCHGCGILEGQLKGDAAVLEEKVALVHAFGGNFLAGRYYSSMTVAGATFTTPGVPFSVLFAVEPTSLRYRALCLGPFNPPVAKEASAFLEGASKWVPEAAGVPIGLAFGGKTMALASREGFRADLALAL